MSEMIYKLKVQDRNTKKIDYIIMGDSYKPFPAHFQDIISFWTEKWLYDDSTEGKGKCLGRTITMDILEVWSANEKFVSFGGLKSCSEENYDKHVEEHNKSKSYPPCKYLKDIDWKVRPQGFIAKILKENRVIFSEGFSKEKSSEELSK
jgi:hypothetical protein